MTQGILLKVAYDGTGYHGMALQPGAPTIAGSLLDAIHRMDPSVASIRFVSRTDAGVHAKAQFVAFDSAKPIAPRGWVLGLNRYLPEQIAVQRSWLAAERFDPRDYVLGKWYRYSVYCSPARDPFLHRFSWKISHAFELDRARQAAALLVGTHDFAAFRSSSDTREQTTRTLFDVKLHEDPERERLIHIDVRGQAFLHNMVRIIVGTLVDVARGKLEPGVITQAFQSGNRTILGRTAPAHGLTLRHVALDPGVPLHTPWPESPGNTDTWTGWKDLVRRRNSD